MRNGICSYFVRKKLTVNPFVIDKSYAKVLLNKLEVFEKQLNMPKQVFIAMISVAGLKKNAWSQELIHGIVTIKDLFN